MKKTRDTTKYVHAQDCQNWRTVTGLINLFLCVHGAPTWLLPSGKYLKLVTPDHWKLSLANSEYHKKKTRGAWDSFACEGY